MVLTVLTCATANSHASGTSNADDDMTILDEKHPVKICLVPVTVLRLGSRGLAVAKAPRPGKCFDSRRMY